MQPNGNGNLDPVPPLAPLVPPYFESVYNMIVKRIRAAGTIFGDRVKLVLRQVDDAHWSKLKKPYLLVVPRQVRAPRELDVDYMSWINPREVTFIAQFDARMSEQEYMAANDIDTAEGQLVYVLANWQPETRDRGYKPTTYAGMRIQATRAPDVKVHYIFMFNEVVIRQDAAIFDESELPEELTLDTIGVRIIDPCCFLIPPEPIQGPKICVQTNPICESPVTPPDPCAPPPCPPVLGGDDASTEAKEGRAEG